MNKDSVYFKNLIIKRLEEESESLKQQFSKKNQIHSFVIDDLLPFPDVEDIYNSFPESSDMKIKKSLREFKSIDAQLDNHNPILEHITFAFQHQDILRVISDITGIDSLSADSSLYAGGISRMEKGNFLNPHLDNSHNNDRDMYRVLNLLFYVTPNRSVEDGGNLELWDNGPRQENRVVAAKYNRLVVMATDQNAWHSVSRVMQGDRCCISNYYFSENSPTEGEYFHITTFTGYPNQILRTFLLRLDSGLRTLVRRVFKKGVVNVSHIYKQKKP